MTSPASKRNNVSTVPIDSIFASPENDEIYGAIDPTDIDLVNLANDIAQNGIREPIHVSTDGHVISGHRRLAASKLVKLNHVTVLQIPISRVDYTSAEWKSISDETRPITGTCFSKDVAAFFDLQFHNFLRWYRRDLMQSQPDHIELIVEKLTVQGIINPIANQYCVPMTVGRGYCSLSPRKAIVERFERSGKDRLVLLIASDFDPDGEEIAQSFARSCRDDFNVEVVARKILLTSSQIKKWKLPPNGMEAKQSSKQFAKFVSQYKSNRVYELEAVSPKLMQATVKEAIEGVIDSVAFNNELALEKQDARILQAAKNIAVEQLRLCLPDLFRT